MTGDVWLLAGHVALLSLLSIGGIMTVLPDIHRVVVDEYHWLSSADFAAMVALGQAAPGPNFLLITLIGYQVGGLAGALVATVAMVAPSSMVAFVATHLSGRIGDAPWKRIVQRGLAPIAVGLVLGAGYLLATGTGHGLVGYAITGCAAIAAVLTRVNPLWLLAAAAAAGAALL